MASSGLVPVFVDTSLDTHLATAVSPHDTVASLKRKLVSEHGLCFPEVGRIDIEALTTCWQGKEYRLSDTLSISVVLQMEGGSFLKALVGTQLRPDTDKQPVVCFAGPTEVVNTSLKKKKKRKRNIVTFEDTTTLRPTQSRKVGEEEFQDDVAFPAPKSADSEDAINKVISDILADLKKGIPNPPDGYP